MSNPAFLLAPVSHPSALLDIYDGLMVRRQELTEEAINLDRQLQEARLQLKSALGAVPETTSVRAERNTSAQLEESSQEAEVTVTAVVAPVPFSKLHPYTKKSLSALLKAFPTNRGVFRTRDIIQVLKISKSSACQRIARGVKLGYFKAVGHGQYMRA